MEAEKHLEVLLLQIFKKKKKSQDVNVMSQERESRGILVVLI